MTQGLRTRLNVERINHGLPLISADPNGWDNGFTLNPTAVRLERSPVNDDLIRGLLGRHALNGSGLQDGVIAVFYRGIPKEVPGRPLLRSSVGLAVFTPTMQLIKRFAYPLVVPTDDPMGYDYNGVEDQRITRIGDTFYMLYCGFNPNLPIEHNIHICMAVSTDLLHWTKLGPISGDVNNYPNKDGVLLSDMVDGKYMMFHRPMIGTQNDYGVSLAVSNSPTGEWKDLGTIMKAEVDPRYCKSWMGAGSAPISLGNNRYLADFHTGNYLPGGERDYFSGYAILNLNDIDTDNPSSVVECRCSSIIEPQTPYELHSPWPHEKNLNCVFSSGSFEHGEDVVLLYGGADAYVLGARFGRDELVNYLETFGTRSNTAATTIASAV
ncbi:MAG: hypothetical protein ABFD83_01520 [Armatimonadota bacterium]